MNGKTKEKLSDIGRVLRFITPILIALILFILNGFRSDIRDVRAQIFKISKDIVYKCDYTEDQKRLWEVIDNITKRLDKRRR